MMPILRNKDLSVIQVLLFIALMIPVSLFADNKISVQQAYKMASDNQIILIDIRSRGEWKETGVASVARPISMHEADFLPRFKQVLEEANGRPVALICAIGGRTSWLQKELTGRGVKNVLDVSEGMFGSRDGPGWVRSGLPVREYSEVVDGGGG